MMKRFFINAGTAVALLSITFIITAPEGLAQQQDFRRVPVVYTLPGMDKVTARRDVTYKTAGDKALKLDVYYPPGSGEGARLPAVIFVNGVGADDMREWQVYIDWAKLTAVSGFVAITHQSRAAESSADAADLISYVRTNADSLRIDANRLGIWSCSANVRITVPIIMQPDRKYIRCAVLYYGVMTPHATRANLPLFIARAGLDNPNLNRGIDGFVSQALTEGAPLTLINYEDGQHAFDVRDNNDKSREFIRQTLDFMKFHLSRDYAEQDAGRRAPTPPQFAAMIAKDGFAKSLQVYKDAKKADPGALIFQENTLNQLGYELLQAGSVKEALEVFKLNAEEHPNSPNVYDSLADGYEADGNRELALKFSEKALELLAAAQGLSEERKTAIRNSASDKVKRLKGQ
ncbi:MAG TPA: hypothetical protein VE262_11655 [Blastocatellia bacterium]|nr:hypothetical protein [Blastocatellia bacterium]